MKVKKFIVLLYKKSWREFKDDSFDIEMTCGEHDIPSQIFEELSPLKRKKRNTNRLKFQEDIHYAST